MNARRAVGAVVLAVVMGGALMAAGAALPLPPVGSPNQLGSWWADRGPAVAAFSVVRLAGLIGAGYLALVGSVALLGALTRWRWTLSLSKLAARPGLMRFLVGGSLVAALSTPSEAAARPGPLLTVTDTGPAAASVGPDTGAALTVADLGPGAMRSRPAAAAVAVPDTAGAALTVADLGPSRARAQPASEGPFTFPSAEVRTAMTGVADSGAEVTTADNRPSELRTAEADDPGAETWIVEAGDHLWAIAAETVADRTGHTDDESVGAYWQRLIEANRHIVGDDPDLIHPGQIIELPE